MNLWDLLTGSTRPPASAPDIGRKIRCQCGRRVGVIAGDGRVWLAGYEHTPAGTADVLISTALEDAELAIRAEDVEALGAISELIRLSGSSDERGDLDRLAGVVPRLRVPARWAPVGTAAEERLPGPVGAVPMGCRGCRSIYDARGALREGETTGRGDVVATGSASVADTYYEVPRDGLPSRVVLYRQLSAVLS